MGNFSSKSKLKDNSKQETNKIVKTWTLLESKNNSFLVFQNEKEEYSLSVYRGKDNILFIEQISENTMIIGVYNDLFQYYGEHIILKRQEGGIIWKYPFSNIKYGFYIIEKDYKVFPQEENIPLFIQPLYKFLNDKEIHS